MLLSPPWLRGSLLGGPGLVRGRRGGTCVTNGTAGPGFGSIRTRVKDSPVSQVPHAFDAAVRAVRGRLTPVAGPSTMERDVGRPWRTTPGPAARPRRSAVGRLAFSDGDGAADPPVTGVVVWSSRRGLRRETDLKDHDLDQSGRTSGTGRGADAKMSSWPVPVRTSGWRGNRRPQTDTRASKHFRAAREP